MPIFYTIDGIRLEASRVKEYKEKKAARLKAAKEKKAKAKVQKKEVLTKVEVAPKIEDENLVFKKNK